MMPDKKTIIPSTRSSYHEIVITQIYNTPRTLLYKPFSGSGHLTQSWGYQGFAPSVCEFDVRPGGAIRIRMRTPDGALHPMLGTYA